MPITIRRISTESALYEAELTPPHGRGVAWSTPRPLSRAELIAELRERGCHQTDIGDAFHDADLE